MTPEQLVDNCLDQMGPIEMTAGTRDELIANTETSGSVSWASDEDYSKSARRTADLLALIAATREYQFG